MSTSANSEYGQIASREDFFRVLSQARAVVKKQLDGAPGDVVFMAIGQQLDAMQEWTADGRTPSEEERARVCIGVIGVRELDGSPNEEVQKFAEWLNELNAYFEDWPA